MLRSTLFFKPATSRLWRLPGIVTAAGWFGIIPLFCAHRSVRSVFWPFSSILLGYVCRWVYLRRQRDWELPVFAVPGVRQTETDHPEVHPEARTAFDNFFQDPPYAKCPELGWPKHRDLALPPPLLPLPPPFPLPLLPLTFSQTKFPEPVREVGGWSAQAVLPLRVYRLSALSIQYAAGDAVHAASMSRPVAMT